MQIEIHSPPTTYLQPGKIGEDFKRGLTVAAAESKDGHYVLAFDTANECDRFVEFIRFVQHVNKSDGFYTIRFVEKDEWISGRLIERPGNCTIVIYHYRPGEKYVRKNVKAV
jgi:hypothetical protein